MSGALLVSGEPIPPDPSQTCYTPLQIATFGFLQEADFTNLTLATFGWLCGVDAPNNIKLDYCDAAVDRLAEQYKNSPNIKTVLCAFVNRIQELEFVFQDLQTLRSISTATNNDLDVIGEIVGLDRMGLTDEPYRTALRLQIVINTSNGEPESVIAYTLALTLSTTIILKEIQPARIVLTSNGPVASTAIVRQIETSVGAGIAVELNSTFGNTPVFTFLPDAGTPAIPDSAGYSEPTVPNSGGHYTEKFT